MMIRSQRFFDLLLLALSMLAMPGLTPGQAQPGEATAQDAEKEQDKAPEIKWLTDMAAAKGEAKKTGKPILYYYRCDP